MNEHLDLSYLDNLPMATNEKKTVSLCTPGLLTSIILGFKRVD